MAKKKTMVADGVRISMRNEPPDLDWMPVKDLHLDDSYQRPLHGRQYRNIERMKLEWDWGTIAPLMVARRMDGKHFVYDGQSRLVAAKKRGDIPKLPCAVVGVNGVVDAGAEEARRFHIVNTMQVPPTRVDDFKALVRSGDPAACDIKRILIASGFEVASHSGNRKVGCVAILMLEYNRNPKVFEIVWNIAAKISYNHKGCMSAYILKGLFFLYRALDVKTETPALTPENVDKLVAAGVQKINESIAAAAVFLNDGRGSSRVYAEGLLQVINKRRHADNQLTLA